MNDVRFACLTIGSELLDGRVIDTNSKFLAKELWRHGFRLDHIVTCGDEFQSIINTLSYLTKQYQLVIITGGLGPTDDDRTREALARFCGVTLIENTEAVLLITEMLAIRHREMTISNRRQALMPEGAEIIRNQYGTAPGFKITKDNCTMVALPGVPKELYPMVVEEVLPWLVEKFNIVSLSKLTSIRVAGIPESDLNEILSNLSIPSTIEVAYQVKYPEIIVQLRGDDSIASTMKQIINALPPECLISNAGEQGAYSKLVELLQIRKETLAITDTATQGLLLHELCQINNFSSETTANLSGVIKGGWFFCQDNLDEPAAVLDNRGRCSADWGLGVFQAKDQYRVWLIGGTIKRCFLIKRPFVKNLRLDFLSWVAADIARRELSGEPHFSWIELE